MQGHVDGVGTVAAVAAAATAREVRFSAPAGLLRYVVEKGSVDGRRREPHGDRGGRAGFSVSLIPETLERTTLGTGRPGRPVNLEVDVIAKYVEKLVQR